MPGKGSLQEVKELCFRNERKLMSKMGCDFQRRALEAFWRWAGACGVLLRRLGD